MPSRLVGWAAEMDVLRDAQIVHHGKFLMHHANAGGPRIAGRREVDRPPVESHGTLVLGMHAGDDLHQRGLAGTVLADEPVDFAGRQGEMDRPQCRHAAERLVDPGKLQQRRPGRLGHARLRSGNVPPSTSFRARLPW